MPALCFYWKINYNQHPCYPLFSRTVILEIWKVHLISYLVCTKLVICQMWYSLTNSGRNCFIRRPLGRERVSSENNTLEAIMLRLCYCKCLYMSKHLRNSEKSQAPCGLLKFLWKTSPHISPLILLCDENVCCLNGLLFQRLLLVYFSFCFVVRMPVFVK